MNYSAFFQPILALDIMNFLSWQNYWGGGQNDMFAPPPQYFHWWGDCPPPPPPPQDRRPLVDKHLPTRQKRIRKNTSPWMKSDIFKLMKQGDKEKIKI